MNHQFSIEIATIYGVDMAIFLDNIAFWTHRNIGNNKNYRENNYWVYNSLESWIILFPYWSLQNVRTIIDKCVNNGLLIKNNSLNKRKGDRTYWYAMTKKCIELYPLIKSLLDTKVIHTHLLKSTNGVLEPTEPFVGINTALPDSKPDNKQQIKSSYASQVKKSTEESKLNQGCELVHGPELDRSKQKFANEQKHAWADPKAPLASVTNQSTSHNPDRPGRAVKASALIEEHMEKMRKMSLQQVSGMKT